MGVSESGIRQELGTDDRERKVEFETFLIDRTPVGEMNAAAVG